MASRENRDQIGERDREVQRYREAATQALEQLEWCIDYLYGLRKVDIARALARNRAQIVERVRNWG